MFIFLKDPLFHMNLYNILHNYDKHETVTCIAERQSCLNSILEGGTFYVIEKDQLD